MSSETKSEEEEERNEKAKENEKMHERKQVKPSFRLEHANATQGGRDIDSYAVYLNFDGLCEPMNPGGIATYGVVIRGGRNHELIEEKKGLALAEPWTDLASNNVAEYSALILGLEWLIDHGMQDERIVVRGDSSLVINQLSGKWKKAKAARIRGLYLRALELLKHFKNVKLEWVDREQNKQADLLSRIAYREARKVQRPK